MTVFQGMITGAFIATALAVAFAVIFKAVAVALSWLLDNVGHVNTFLIIIAMFGALMGGLASL